MKEYLKTKNGILYNADCLDVMDYLSKKNIKFDLILTDLPYGITKCKWDSIIPFDKMWDMINKVVNDNTPICLFGCEPFSTKLRLSNLKNFKYDWYWIKNIRTGHLNSNRMPLKNIEIISIFYNKQCYYFPILRETKASEKSLERYKYIMKPLKIKDNVIYGKEKKSDPFYQSLKVKPDVTLSFNCIPRNSINRLHPTQKPVSLYEYLIKTYTKENDLVLDFCSGSGTLGIACENLNRKYIMIEKELKYCEIIKKRLIENKIKILNNKIKLRKRR